MAKIWPVYEGKRPTIGEPWADLPVAVAAALFELKSSDLVSDFVATPRFGDVSRDLWWAGFKHVVVEVEPNEASDEWEAGFYKSRIKPREAFRRLLEHALVTELGRANVVRVEYEATADSLGQNALRVIVVLTPGAPQRLADGPVRASVRLHDQLRQMRVARTPLIEYATEAELAQDAGP